MSNKYDLSGWDLTELLPDTAEETIAARLTELEQEVSAFEAMRDQLNGFSATQKNGAGPGLDLIPFMQAIERISEQMYVLGAYGSLWFPQTHSRKRPYDTKVTCNKS